MYGPYIGIKHNGVDIVLSPFCKEYLPTIIKGFSSLSVQMYTHGLFAQVLENEQEWYDKTRKSPDVVSWAIVPEGGDTPIGVTALHDILSIDGGCTSGIIIWDKDWWGKGVATAAHLGRTLFASDFLNRSIIRSCVRTVNPGSFKALQRNGYTIWGTEPNSDWKNGQWLHTYHLIWFHPERISYLFPEGAPEIYREGIDKAMISLKLARSVVTVL